MRRPDGRGQVVTGALKRKDMVKGKYMVNTILHCMATETKVTDSNQTQVPASLRAKHNVAPGDLVVWEENESGEIRVRFRSRQKLRDLVGIAPGAARGDSVAAKRRAQRKER